MFRPSTAPNTGPGAPGTDAPKTEPKGWSRALGPS